MLRPSPLPPSLLALALLALARPLASAQAARSDIAPPAFLTLRVRNSNLVIDRYTQGSDGGITLATSHRVPTSKAIGPVDYDASGLLSPDGHWLAVHLASDGFIEGFPISQPVGMVIIDLRQHKIAYEERERVTRYSALRGWRDADTLQVARAPVSPFRPVTFEMSAPRWIPREVGEADNSNRTARATSEAKQANLDAARLLTERGYVMHYNVAQDGSPGPLDDSWEHPLKLDGETGAVSPDGSMIATLTTSGPGDRARRSEVFVVLKRPDGWAEHRLPITDRIEAVQFWRDYLVVTTSRNNLPDRFVTLWRLADLSMALEVPADSFVPE